MQYELNLNGNAVEVVPKETIEERIKAKIKTYSSYTEMLLEAMSESNKGDNE